MNKPKSILVLILVTLGIVAYAVAGVYLGGVCPLYEWFKIPCLTCGMTRAMRAVLRLDFAAAFGYHPLYWTVPLLYWMAVTELEPFKNKRVNKIVIVSLLSAFVAVWVVKMIVTFA